MNNDAHITGNRWMEPLHGSGKLPPSCGLFMICDTTDFLGLYSTSHVSNSLKGLNFQNKIQVLSGIFQLQHEF